MKFSVRPFLAGVVVLWFASMPGQAQVASDGASVTLANVTNTLTGTVTVGTNGSFTLLTLADNALLTNSAHGVIGRNATAKSNEVRLISPTARWLMGNSLFVSSNGSFNRLVISAGARVGNNDAFVGLGAASINNEVVVTGSGSFWTNRSHLYLGEFGSSGNRLVVSNGALVVNNGGLVGFAPSSTDNSVLVTGAGSTWSNRSSVSVGQSGNGNLLTISDGGQVFSMEGYVGAFSANNQAVVTGAGSVWSNLVDLNVGNSGSGNQLIVSNGGLVSANSNINVGVASSSLNNRVVVNGGTLRAANATGTGVLDVRRGTNQFLSGLIDTDRLVLTNAAGRFEFLGGTLITRGAFLTNGSGMVLGLSGTTPAVWEVRPGLSDHKVSLGVSVGQVTPLNQLNITGGASLSNGVGGFIGLGASSNAATVSGPGSRWQVAGDVFPGAGGAFNRLTVEAGGRVQDVAGRMLSSSNVALVTGLGSLWSNATIVTVGETGSGNQLQVSDGGLVIAASGSIGQGATANANTAQITDAGSEGRFSSSFNVGSGGSFNQLLVSGGARVSDFSSIIGGTATGSNNSAIVSGPGSLWNHASDFTVGGFGERNELLVSNGGMVASPFGGVGDSAAHNLAVVTGSGSVWSNDFNLNVGYFGHSNRVLIQNSGLLVSGQGSIGDTGQSNQVIITGPGSIWNNRLDLTVGFSGRDNQLLVSDGGTALTGGDARIGSTTVARSNAVVTAGPEARWLVTSNIYVGVSGSDNRLVVSNGGFVSGSDGLVGYDFEASNNLVLVTGAGSVWSNANNLQLGVLFSAGNQLVVSNGGLVVSRSSTIGNLGGSNLVTVTGPGSSWKNTSDLILGAAADANRLVVNNAGQVTSRFGSLQSSSNEVLVTGSGSLWSNRFDLSVGLSGGANRLLINNGGTVFAGHVIVGSTPESTNNRVVVNGGTLRATNATGSSVLDVRRGTNVLNAGLVDVDKLVLTNRLNLVTSGRFGNASLITIPANGPATTYPSTIAVAGLDGIVTKVTVTLSNISHSIPADLDILLVGPAGQKMTLMTDAGSVHDLNNATIFFDDASTRALPELTAIEAGGLYRPTTYQVGGPFPAPAPAPPYATSLAVFNGSNPNGVWSLYVFDDQVSEGGSLKGWSVQITTDPGPFLLPCSFELNGGTLITRGAVIENALPFVVGGPGGVPAIWEARAGLTDNFVARDLLVGNSSSFNQLVILSGGVTAGQGVIVGSLAGGSSNNLLRVTGGTLRVLNPGHVLNIRDGTNRLDAGLVDVLHLVVTNTRGQFEFNGGTLRTLATTISNGRVFTVGGGASTATLQLLGGTHTFDNNLTVATNGSLIGTGTVDGTVTVSAGGRLTPGAPIGSMDVLGSVILQGTVTLQIDKSGGVRTSDLVTADGAIFYNGTLTVTDIGSDVLAAGDRFFLFDATPYVGAFTTLNLPPLAPGLAWRNNLSVDGSIEVITAGGQPGIASIIRSGNSIVFSGTNGTPGANYTVLASTNVALPATNWTVLATRQFDAGGGFVFTNAILPGIPQRFYRLRVP